MKKHRHNRHRPQPRAAPQKQPPAPDRPNGTMLRQPGWFVGIGLLLLVGFFVWQKHRAAIGSNAPVANTSAANDLDNQPARLLPGAGSSPTFPGATNRPGAVLNR